MISDKERREAAARLRTQADKLEARNPDGLYTAADLMFRLFDLVGATQARRLHDAFRFIADLIDRPTCRDISERDGEFASDVFTCSACGNGITTWDGSGGWLDVRYCPFCGAEVVHDD